MKKTEGTNVADIIERINALREDIDQQRLTRKQDREMRKRIAFWRRQLAWMLSSHTRRAAV